ncbi:MAG: pyridoxal-phosphate dependent enzyme [Thermofilaceae archaeon]
MQFWLACSSCGVKCAFDSLAWKCICGAPFDIVKDLSSTSLCFTKLTEREKNIWRYRDLLPLIKSECLVSLGEGFTPVLIRRMEGYEVILKLDFMNPTGSFKDRGASVMLSNLKALEVESIVIDSSGNAGAAVAAYSAAAGIRCKVYVPANAPSSKKLQISLYGAELVEVEGARSLVREKALAELGDAVYASHMWNPYFIEGLKTLAYECFEQAGLPDAVVVPVGSGGLLLGMYGGFCELKKLGLIDNVPAIIAVQAAGYTPVYDVLHGPHGVEPPAEPFADGIAIPNPPRLKQIIKAVQTSGGDAVVVEDSMILEALSRLAKIGLFVEPTAATPLAALKNIKAEGIVDAGSRVYIPLTGSGLKAVDKIMNKIPVKR